MNQRRNRLRSSRLDSISSFGQVSSLFEPRSGVVMQCAQRLAALDGVSNALVESEAHGRVVRVILLFPSAAEHHASHAQLLALNGGDISSRGTGDIERLLGMRKAPRIVHYSDVSTLQAHDFAEFLA